MNATRMIETKDQILQQFARLQAEYAALAAKIETREEEASRREDREVVAAANKHTVEDIVTGLAGLQLRFSTIIQDTSEQLSAESERLEQLRRAILVETRRLEQLKQVQIAADAVDILKQEQAEQTRAFEADSADRKAALEQTVSDSRASWEVDQAAFVQRIADEDAALTLAREEEEADHRYALARKLEEAADDFALRRRTVAREQAEALEACEADWAAREDTLAAQQEQHAVDQKRIEAFPAQLEAAKKAAREQAIKKAARDAETAASLLAEEVTSQHKVLGYQVAVHKAKVTRNAEEIERLEAQLSALRLQAQQRATQALTVNHSA